MDAVQVGHMQIVPAVDDRPLIDKLLTGQTICWDRDNPEHRNLLLTLMDDVYSDTFNEMANSPMVDLMDFPHINDVRTDVAVTYSAYWNLMHCYMAELCHVLNCGGHRGCIVTYPGRDIEVGMCYTCDGYLEWDHGPEELWNRIIRSMMQRLLNPLVVMPSFTTDFNDNVYLMLTSAMPRIHLPV